jgi:hypothetical protein
LAGQRFGDRPTGIAAHPSLFAIPLPRGPWMIVGVFPTGCDDQGRPGALGFHGLFVSKWTYLWAGSNPFVFAGTFRREWQECDMNVVLPAGAVTVPVWKQTKPDHGEIDRRVVPIVTAIKRKRRVVIGSAEPIDELAQAVWRALPARVRMRASVASWAFSNENRFDLVALPRLGALAPDSSETVFNAETMDPGGGALEGWSTGPRLWHAGAAQSREEGPETENGRGE